MKGGYVNKIIWVTLPAFLLLACLKEKDKTSDGPKTGITIVNAALNSGLLFLRQDGQVLPQEGIAFGQASGPGGNAYLFIRPGVSELAWQWGNDIPGERKLFQWPANKYFTILHFDTLRNGTAPWIVLEDQAETSDTLARARFINCVAGPDSISLWLINPADTVVMASKMAYLGRSGAASNGFDVSIEPGNWRFEMFSANGVLLDAGELPMAAKTLYSFVATGESGGTGARQPALLPLVQQPR